MRYRVAGIETEAQAGGNVMSMPEGRVRLDILGPSDSDRGWRPTEPLLTVIPDDEDNEDFEELFPEEIRIPLAAVEELLREYRAWEVSAEQLARAVLTTSTDEAPHRGK